MTEAGVAELGRRFGLSRDACRRLAILATTLADDPNAPISARARTTVVDDHLADALVGLELGAVREAGAIVDIGSGAGIPALPLAIARPTASIVALDGNARKVEFITRAAAACDVANLEAVVARAEAWPDGHDRFDLVTARALAPLPVVAEYAAPLLRLGGALVAWRGRRDPADERAAEAAADALGLGVEEIRQVFPYPGAAQRHLHVLRKLAPTPERFPRRGGVARKRPLGARV